MIANRAPRPTKLIRAVVAVAVASTTVAACSSGPTVNNSKSAATLASLALQNAEKAGWVHEVVDSSGSGHTLSMSNDLGASEGRQVITPDGAHATVILVGGVAYVQGDAAAVKNYFGLPSTDSTQLAGKWISLRSSDSGFSTVSAAVTIKSDFSQVGLTGQLTKGPVTDLDGQRVIPVQGSMAAPGGGPTVDGTLYVTAEGQVLPVELRASGQGESETVVWSRWGQPLQLAAPPGAVPISSIGG
jgi:hypothetical protein